MSNKTEQILIVREGPNDGSDSGPIIGFVLPGGSCVLSEDALYNMGLDIPAETPCNVVRV